MKESGNRYAVLKYLRLMRRQIGLIFPRRTELCQFARFDVSTRQIQTCQVV